MDSQQPSLPDENLARMWESWLSGMSEFYMNMLESLAVILVLVLIRFALLRAINRNIEDNTARYRWRKNVVYILSFAGFLIIGRIWFEGVSSLATFLGLLTAGVVIALRDPLVDMAGWVFLLWRKPFEVGDRIQVAEDRGDVIDIRLFKFSLLEIGNWVHADQSTGRVVHIPNRMIFAHSIANYTSQIQFIWNEIEVIVTFESDWRRAKTILEEIAEELLGDLIQDAEQQVKRRSASYLIHYQFLTPIVYSEVAGNGVRLTLRHLTHPRKRRSTSMLIWEEILARFEKEQKIDFAYETVRIYRNPTEGKPDLRDEPGPQP